MKYYFGNALCKTNPPNEIITARESDSQKDSHKNDVK